MPGVSVVTAPTLAELAQKAGISPEGLEETVHNFNASITGSSPFDPNVKDGRRADTQPPKSNWARSIATGPFYAFPVTCGITFTFGGLKTDTWGRVLTEDAEPLILFYRTYQAQGSRPTANALDGLRYALDLAPQDAKLRLEVVGDLLRENQVDEARDTLTSLAYSPHAGKAHDTVRRLYDALAAKNAKTASSRKANDRRTPTWKRTITLNHSAA